MASCFSSGREKNLSFISYLLTVSVNDIIIPLTDFEKTLFEIFYFLLTNIKIYAKITLLRNDVMEKVNYAAG